MSNFFLVLCHRCSFGKAPGIDNLQAELLKADIDYATTKVKEIIDIV